jgi:hypothetical protein
VLFSLPDRVQDRCYPAAQELDGQASEASGSPAAGSSLIGLCRGDASSALAAQAGQYSPGMLAVGPVLPAETVQHHLLLPRPADEIQQQECRQSSQARYPILQQQRLGDGPYQLGGIHRVANCGIDPDADQLLIIPDFGRGRPVLAKIVVCPPEQP